VRDPEDLLAFGTEIDIPLSKDALQPTTPDLRQILGAMGTDGIDVLLFFNR
jgi:hypothetical protein